MGEWSITPYHYVSLKKFWCSVKVRFSIPIFDKWYVDGYMHSLLPALNVLSFLDLH